MKAPKLVEVVMVLMLFDRCWMSKRDVSRWWMTSAVEVDLVADDGLKTVQEENALQCAWMVLAMVESVGSDKNELQLMTSCSCEVVVKWKSWEKETRPWALLSLWLRTNLIGGGRHVANSWSGWML